MRVVTVTLGLILLLARPAGAMTQRPASVGPEIAPTSDLGSGPGIVPHREWLESGPGRQVAPASAMGLSGNTPRFGESKTGAPADAGSTRPGTEGPPVVGAASVATLSTTALDANFPGLGGSANPSDGALAVGATQVLEVVNGRPGQPNFGVFDKSGRRLISQPLTSFFGLDPATTMTDPRAFYDSTSGRWFVLGFSVSFNPPTARFHLAISKTSDATGAFCSFSKDQSIRGGVSGQAVSDFPGLAMDEYALYVTLVRYPFSDLTRPFETEIEMFPRASLDCAASGLDPFVWSVARTAPDGRSVWELQPTVAYDPSGVAYFVGTSPGGSYVAIWNITHSASPLLNTNYVAVIPYSVPPDSPQPGTSVLLDTSDARVASSPVFRRGSLWFAFSALASRAPYSAVRWYEVLMPSLVVRQSGEAWNTTSAWAYPAVTVDAFGSMFLSAAAVGPTDAVSQTLLSRASTDPMGVIGPAVAFTGAGTGYRNVQPGDLSARWGDYFGLALDPDGIHVWAEGSFSVDGLSWSTAIASVHATTAGPVANSYRVTLSDPNPIAGATITATAQALDSTGAPLAVSAQAVSWSALPTGVGSFLPISSATNAQGVATTQFTTSKTAGLTYTLTATASAGASGTSNPFTTRSRPALTSTVYLPNVTKTLGGPAGFQTPFIVQNVGTTSADLELNFYRFTDGVLIAQRLVSGIQAGASYADVPNNDGDLPDDTQFSVVVNSFGARIVSVVNQHKGNIEADAYAASSIGATTVYLPNVVRRFFGFHSPIIIQNLGAVVVTANATFVSFDGSAPRATITRTIAPGQSQFIEPNVEPSLVDGKQYAVTITSPQPISVVINTHNDDPGVAQPAFYSANGISTGAATVYGAYAVKNANGNRVSTIVVQNLGAGPLTPSLTFTALSSGGATQTLTAPASVQPGGSWAFDPRFVNGVASPDPSKLCGAPTATCLGNGEYSFTAQSSGGSVAAMVNVIGPDSAMGYSASATPAATYNLPNVLASYGGWTTPIYLQSVSASGATLTWTPFTGGAAVTRNVTLTPGQTTRIDPNATVPQGAQYAVTVTGSGGTLAAIVMELNVSGGDNAMIYGGFPAP